MDAWELMKGAIETHVHIPPDQNFRRRLNAYELVTQAKEAGMRGVVIKSHDYITTPLAYTLQILINGIEIYGSMALNYEVGGLNPAAVAAAGKIGTKIVWFPTFSSKNDMQKKGIKNKGITILNETGEILPVVTEVLETIKRYDMTLATGHLSTREVLKLLDEAERVGVRRTIASHPMSQSLGADASLDDQKRMIRKGVFIEHCFIVTMPTSDRLDPRKMAEAIRAIGPEHCIMSTDFGQIFNPPPVEGMRMFIETMLSCGITEDEIITMVRVNPARALGL
jgi:hypothetical protein